MPVYNHNVINMNICTNILIQLLISICASVIQIKTTQPLDNRGSCAVKMSMVRSSEARCSTRMMDGVSHPMSPCSAYHEGVLSSCHIYYYQRRIMPGTRLTYIRVKYYNHDLFMHHSTYMCKPSKALCYLYVISLCLHTRKNYSERYHYNVRTNYSDPQIRRFLSRIPYSCRVFDVIYGTDAIVYTIRAMLGFIQCICDTYNALTPISHLIRMRMYECNNHLCLCTEYPTQAYLFLLYCSVIDVRREVCDSLDVIHSVCQQQDHNDGSLHPIECFLRKSRTLRCQEALRLVNHTSCSVQAAQILYSNRYECKYEDTPWRIIYLRVFKMLHTYECMCGPVFCPRNSVAYSHTVVIKICGTVYVNVKNIYIRDGR